MRHAVPLGVPDPFLYAEENGSRHLFVSSMEATRIRELGLFEIHVPEELGFVAPGAQGAVGHDMGSGPILPNTPLVVDIFPRDNASAVYTDMTRTFVVGDVTDDVREWHRLCKEALDAAVAEIRAGVEARAVFDLTCDIFEAAGEPTQRTKQPGETLADGFFHGLGHGVGLEVHEAPGMGRLADKTLVAGDVVTVEPGLYRAGYGGVRLEDIVLVTEAGAEVITDYPYDLEP